MFSLYMLSVRFVLITVTQCYTTPEEQYVEVTDKSKSGCPYAHITMVIIDLHWLEIEEMIVLLKLITLRILLILLLQCIFIYLFLHSCLNVKKIKRFKQIYHNLFEHNHILTFSNTAMKIC